MTTRSRKNAKAPKEKGVALRVDNSVETPDLISDAQKLRQILLNLLGNAAKYTDSGEIRLEVRQDDREWLTFVISDTGIGMTEDQLGEIFEAFAQGDLTVGHKYGGTGLGLALCKRFTELLNGRLDVESTKGEGSRFTVSLPIRQVDVDGAATAIA